MFIKRKRMKKIKKGLNKKMRKIKIKKRVGLIGVCLCRF